MDEDNGLGPIEVDARNLHEGVIFYQHRTSHFTVAVDRESGAILGMSPGEVTPASVVLHVMQEVRRYQMSREKMACEAAGDRIEAVEDEKPRFGARLREREV